ncbi:MAG: GNAT family N-acetyltransferase [Pseudomonadota bacterium]
MTIRKATKDDVSDILGLIKELAIYEKEPNAVKTTEEDLLRDGFGENPYFQCLVAETNGQVKAMALYFFCWSTWTGRPSMFLEDLYVRESQRGTGLGLGLLKALAKEAVEKNCARFEWEVLDWNKPARDFYHNIGAEHMDGWLVYRLAGEKLTHFANS